jgi:glyoxylase-like metal-dependent hydrolase (beta-lactamase superfamily II)
MQLITIAALALTAMLVSVPELAQAQEDISKVEIKTTDLGHNTYRLEGQGGNITAIVGADGVILFDTQFLPLHDKIEAALAKVTSEPVKYVIDSHYHNDHVNGNPAFAREGAMIIAQETVKPRILMREAGLGAGEIPPPMDPVGLPTLEYKDRLNVSVGGRTVEVIHVPRAHTDGDSIVWIPDANVLATADLGGAQRGFINFDIPGGGSIDGIIAGLDVAIGLANDQTKVVVGHGPLSTRADLVETRRVMALIRDRVLRMKLAGMSEDEVVAAKPAADLQASRHADDAAAGRFVRTVYETVIKKGNP